nr:MAG TPA: hypothetical protein [Caudoviricetes sp.]
MEICFAVHYHLVVQVYMILIQMILDQSNLM